MSYNCIFNFLVTDPFQGVSVQSMTFAFVYAFML